MASFNKENVYAGYIEFKMPEAMAQAYLETRNKNEKNKNPKEFLINVVNEEFGLKGRCVNVITY